MKFRLYPFYFEIQTKHLILVAHRERALYNVFAHESREMKTHVYNSYEGKRKGR